MQGLRAFLEHLNTGYLKSAKIEITDNSFKEKKTKQTILKFTKEFHPDR